MGSTLKLGSDFETMKVEVIGAMVYPRDQRLRTGYAERNAWSRRVTHDPSAIATAPEIQSLLELPSRRELSKEADRGVKTGTVAGDLLGLMYGQAKCGAPEPSLRAALLHYRGWAPGKRYRDGEALKYSDGQLRTYFQASAPAAHLWAALSLLRNLKDDGESYRAAFQPEGLDFLLGVARSVQDFAETFTPKRTKPAKPVICGTDLHKIPDHIEAVELDF